ncbi:helix-turn-helix domain-containing protein [Actinomadura geliboluensis]|uniref:Helix-turn-helix transcriptional regulator n=1 Tax=Actinomadura geliboluensis TaxID=882440 RepID=A0A5S4H4Z8_9ACTN|nr:helix-turn-helix transcriptional regulator [Actinomadura geliboluensis]TMR33930.1 helix-turn-helix transcriptional regulator [Actinomadura geliboluensis]
MLARESLDPSRSIWHFMAFHLRRYRKAHGMSGQALGDLLDCDRSTVSRYESNTLKLKREHAEIIDRVWNTDGMFTALVGFAERADEGNWLLELAELEARSSRLRMWESSVIPGLFQTPDYARAALSAGTAEDLEAALDRRLARQATVFGKTKPPRVTALLSWAAVSQIVGGPDVMRGQLTRLIELSELPFVSIRIVEKNAGAHPGLDGPFVLLTVGDRDLAYTEAATRGCFLMDPFDVQEVAVRYDLMSDIAAPVGPSRALLEAELEKFT